MRTFGMHDAHVTESAELYALGLLDAREVADIDAHAATCAPCLRALGEAEETIAALERRYHEVAVPTRHIANRWRKYAVAAALIVGLLPSIPLLFTVKHANEDASQRDVAALAMLHSHFIHAQFAPVDSQTAVPLAKVIYPRDRSWIYVIVSGDARYRIRATCARAPVALGTTLPSATISELWTKTPPNCTSLELTNDNTVLERANLR